jgi:hypothetical protein
LKVAAMGMSVYKWADITTIEAQNLKCAKHIPIRKKQQPFGHSNGPSDHFDINMAHLR